MKWVVKFEQILIEVIYFLNHCFHAELITEPSAALTHHFCFLRVAYELLDAGSQGFFIPGRHQQPVEVVLDKVRYSANVTGHHWFAGSHGFN